VGVLFWSIFFYDRELIFPKSLDSVYPFDLNLFQHGIISVLMWLEWLFFQYQISFGKHIGILVYFSLFYTVWLYIQKLVFGNFPYPFYDNLDMMGHVIFNVVVLSSSFFIFYMLCLRYLSLTIF